jgi:hypothetical protein
MIRRGRWHPACSGFSSEKSMSSNEKKPSRLRLNRETFRRLTTQELSKVDGGAFSSDTGAEDNRYCSCSVIIWESSLGQNKDPLHCRGQEP